MKITGRPVDAYVRSAVNGVGATRPAERPSTTAPESKAGDAAKVSISSEARALATSSAPPPGAGQVDPAKVAALRAKIADGSFKVDPQAVAQRMIDTLA